MRTPVASLVLSGLLAALGPATAADFGKAVLSRKWEWEPEKASLLYCVRTQLGDFDVTVEVPRRTDDHPDPAMTVRIRDGGRDVYAFPASSGTVFTRNGDTLYLAQPSLGSGCTVAAYDLRGGKEVWRSELQSRSSQPHSRYRNEVTIDLFDEAVVVTGNETLLRYIEFVDSKTGKTLAKREYPRD
jgi:hypothetical protein